MKSLAFRRIAVCIPGLLVFLTACDASRVGVSPDRQSAISRLALPPKAVPSETSWMSPNAATIKKLLYVSGKAVDVYNFATGKQVGSLKGIKGSQGQCVDAKGDVFITDQGRSSGKVLEYAHGGTKPLKVLETPGQPFGCSIDPTTGDLAVGELSDLLVYPNASGSPRVYSPPSSRFCVGTSPGYDRYGNLYSEGFTFNEAEICELPHGGNSLTFVQDIPTEGGGSYTEGIMWDGKYLTVAFENNAGSNLAATIYQMSESPSGMLTEVSQTILTCQNNPNAVFQPFIVGAKNTPINRTQGTTVIGGPYAEPCGQYAYWSYPAGGNPTTAKSGQLPISGESVSIGK